MTFEGQIDEILPDGRFGVVLENGHRVIVYTAGRFRPASANGAGYNERAGANGAGSNHRDRRIRRRSPTSKTRKIKDKDDDYVL